MVVVTTSISGIPLLSRGALQLGVKWVSLLPGEQEDCVEESRSSRERMTNFKKIVFMSFSVLLMMINAGKGVVGGAELAISCMT